MMRSCRGADTPRTPPAFVLVTDPGPDPDDVKAILIAGTLHRRGDIVLLLVIANGGHQSRARARLARCVLDSIGARGVRVALGSEGKPYEPVAHEYDLRGYDAVDFNGLLCALKLCIGARVMVVTNIQKRFVPVNGTIGDVHDIMCNEQGRVALRNSRLVVGPSRTPAPIGSHEAFVYEYAELRGFIHGHVNILRDQRIRQVSATVTAFGFPQVFATFTAIFPAIFPQWTNEIPPGHSPQGAPAAAAC